MFLKQSKNAPAKCCVGTEKVGPDLPLVCSPGEWGGRHRADGGAGKGLGARRRNHVQKAAEACRAGMFR